MEANSSFPKLPLPLPEFKFGDTNRDGFWLYQWDFTMLLLRYKDSEHDWGNWAYYGLGIDFLIEEPLSEDEETFFLVKYSSKDLEYVKKKYDYYAEKLRLHHEPDNFLGINYLRGGLLEIYGDKAYRRGLKIHVERERLYRLNPLNYIRIAYFRALQKYEKYIQNYDKRYPTVSVKARNRSLTNKREALGIPQVLAEHSELYWKEKVRINKIEK